MWPIKYRTEDGTPGEKASRWNLDIEMFLDSIEDVGQEKTKQRILEYIASEFDKEYSMTALCSQNYKNKRVYERLLFFAEVDDKIKQKG